MYQNRRILALIPARGGSKGIKNKNIIDLCGKPLLSYSVESGINSTYIDDVVVTTDSPTIADVAKNYGAWVPFLRPAALALDTSKTIDCVLHAVRTLEDMGHSYDLCVLLQPTQPLRTSEDIDQAIRTFYEKNAQSLVSVSPVSDAPVLIRQVNADGTLVHLLNQSSTVRRQDMQPYYVVNGCIYINRICDLCETTSFNDNQTAFVMAEDHSVDIDALADLAVARYYLEQNK